MQILTFGETATLATGDGLDFAMCQPTRRVTTSLKGEREDRMRIFRGIAPVLAVLLCVSAAEAAPITGAMSISGNFRPVDGATGAFTPLGAATGLDFFTGNGANGTGITPGVAGSFLVTAASGNFSSFLGQNGLIRDFSFAGAGSTNFPNLGVPLISFQSIGGLTFTLTSIAAPIVQNNNLLVLSGQGILSMAGFTDTPGIFDFSSTGAFNFSSRGAGELFNSGSTTGAQVPEPASLALLGGGLLVCAAVLGRRRRVTR